MLLHKKIAYTTEKSIFVKRKNVSYFYSMSNYDIALARKDVHSIATDIKLKERWENIIDQITPRKKKIDDEMGQTFNKQST